MANSVTIRTTAPGAKDAAKDVKGLADAYKRLGQEGISTSDKMRILGGGMTAAGRQMTMGVTLPILAAGGAAIKLAVDAEETEARLTSAFQSMGASSWTSLEALRTKAEELMSRTTFDDEAIKDAQAVMLTFGNVTGSAFDQGVESALNLSEALGTDLQSATIMIGKALNDPVGGITAMTRAGIQFTDEQKNMIRTMVETGDTAGAQTIILGELERQFGGTAEAMAGTASGQMKQAMNELSEVGEDIGRILLPILRDAAGHIRNLADIFQNLSPEVKNAIVTFAGLAAALGPALLIGGKLVGMFSGAAGLIAKVVQMTAATAADTTATVANTTAKGLNARALLGVSGAAAGVAVALYGVNEGLNAASEKAREATDAFRAMDADTLEAAASTEAFGIRADDAADHFANFMGIVAPWHQVANDAADAADALNGRIDDQAGALERSEAAWRDYVAAPPRAAAAVEDTWQRIDQATVHGSQDVMDSWQRMGADLVHEIAILKPKARAEMDEAMDGISDTIRGNKDTVQAAMEDFLFYLNHPLKRQKEIARVEGELTSQRLIDGLNSNDDGIRNAAQDYLAILQEQYRRLTGKSYDAGVDAGDNVADGIEDGYHPPRLPGPYIGEPRGPGANPNRGTHGGNRGETEGERARGGPVKKGEPYLVGEEGPEIVVPTENGMVLSNAQSRAASIGGGAIGAGQPMTIAVHVNLSTREFAERSRHHAVVQAGGPAFR